MDKGFVLREVGTVFMYINHTKSVFKSLM